MESPNFVQFDLPLHAFDEDEDNEYDEYVFYPSKGPHALFPVEELRCNDQYPWSPRSLPPTIQEEDLEALPTLCHLRSLPSSPLSHYEDGDSDYVIVDDSYLKAIGYGSTFRAGFWGQSRLVNHLQEKYLHRLRLWRRRMASAVCCLS